MNTTNKWLLAAKRIRQIMDKAGNLLTDKQASEVVELYPVLHFNGELIAAGTRINWNGALKRAAADIWDTYENNPDNAPTLWEDIAYKDGIRYIPATITAGTAFAKDELGWWEDELYKSLIDSNIWTPEAYPTGWEKQEV